MLAIIVALLVCLLILLLSNACAYAALCCLQFKCALGLHVSIHLTCLRFGFLLDAAICVYVYWAMGYRSSYFGLPVIVTLCADPE